MIKTFIKTILEQMRLNEKIVLLYGDGALASNDDIYGLEKRIINTGISEQNLVAIASGLAKEGLLPVVFCMGAFLAHRANEFIRIDVCMNEIKILLCGYSAGVKNNNLGGTHHATEDIATIRVLPNLTLVSPSSPNEVVPIVKKSLEYPGVVYIRLGKAFEDEIHEANCDFTIGKATIYKEGRDITLVSTGSVISQAIQAAKILEKDGFSVEIINMTTIKPIDSETILQSVRKTGRLLTIEEHQIIGGLGSAVSEVLCGEGQFPFKRIGFNDEFCTQFGWHKDLLEYYGLNALGICRHVRDLIK